MNTANILVKENNALREQLSDENKVFYEDLLVIVRCKALFRDESVYEETLLMILQDLIDAQTAGVSAEEYLGRDSYALADEIIAETPKESSWRIFKLALAGWRIFLAASIIPSTLIEIILSPSHTATISLANFLVGGIYTMLLIAIVLKSFSIHRWVLRVYHQNFFKTWLILLFPSAVFFGIYVLIAWLTQNIWTITI
ncbi:MAG: hypothetical protein LBV19_01975 [Streptococcaceae bacterium]|jgi:hypothetical protein|nr:hypothetical protein [Streptococcaceae bacterium]